ncbi:MAG TPA: hypothetical protein VFQ16_07575 [Burkholderiaceae bacterium]|nr:hypothetical protein [Burkholderiaceae bacterium]
MIKPLTRCAALLLALLPPAALAGRPLQTEDAGVLDRGACEVEGFHAHASAGGASALENSLQLGCGIGLDSQVALAASTARAGGDRERGLALGGKTGLWKAAGDDAPALTLAWGLAWARADGAPRRHAATELRLVYSAPAFAGTVWHANLGHARDEIARQRSTTWALALEHEGFDLGVNLAPMAEIVGDDRQAPLWNLGLRATLQPERVFVDASYGRQIASGRPRLWTLGFKIAF